MRLSCRKDDEKKLTFPPSTMRNPTYASSCVTGLSELSLRKNTLQAACGTPSIQHESSFEAVATALCSATATECDWPDCGSRASRSMLAVKPDSLWLRAKQGEGLGRRASPPRRGEEESTHIIARGCSGAAQSTESARVGPSQQRCSESEYERARRVDGRACEG